MGKRDKLQPNELSGFLGSHPGWSVDGDALVRTFEHSSYAAGVAFAVELAFAAEKRDHHPDLHLGWRKTTVRWTTHDSRGITGVDVELAETSDRLHRG
jgi:4a-hydroxytetrahydrobiopterin dehydratase